MEGRILSAETNMAEAATAGRPLGDSQIKTGQGQMKTSQAILASILEGLEKSKAEEVVQISLSGKSSMADHMIIASGRSGRQISAIAQHLFDTLKAEFGFSAKIEGKAAGDWLLLDAGDVIVHLFRPEVREFYQLEKMWLSPNEA